MGDLTALAWRGINYDTGTNYAGAGLSRDRPSAAELRRDMDAICHTLHCTSIDVSGTDLDRLGEAAEAAATAGLNVWVRPRSTDHHESTAPRAISALSRNGGHGLTT